MTNTIATAATTTPANDVNKRVDVHLDTTNNKRPKTIDFADNFDGWYKFAMETAWCGTSLESWDVDARIEHKRDIFLGLAECAALRINIRKGTYDRLDAYDMVKDARTLFVAELGREPTEEEEAEAQKPGGRMHEAIATRDARDSAQKLNHAALDEAKEKLRKLAQKE